MTWNCARALEKKVGDLEHILREVKPLLFAVQEIGNASMENSTIAGLLAKYKYAGFARHRAAGRRKQDGTEDESTHGGAALFAHSSVQVAAYKWAEADEWSDECESVSVTVTPINGAPPFIFSSLYVHGGSKDVDGFRTVMLSMRDDQIVAGDLNGQLPGSRAGPFAQRGKIIDQVIRERNMVYPTPNGPTRRTTQVLEDGRIMKLDTGTINDHIIIGAAVAAHLESPDSESIVLHGHYTSDHDPLLWSAHIGLVRHQRVYWRPQPAWHRVQPEQQQRYNTQFQHLLQDARAARCMDMAVVERALRQTSATFLPHTQPPCVERQGVYWTEAARRRIDEVVEEHGDGARREAAKTFAEIRKRTLAEHVTVTSDPSSCWDFVRRFFGFKHEQSVRPPLQRPDGTSASEPRDRAETLGAAWAEAHSNPADIDAQEQLKAAQRELPPPGDARCPWNALSVTEMRAAISEMATGRCADFLELRAEHLKLLDDASLEAMRPFFDRCLSRAALPSHWRTAIAVPVPKRKRDPTVLRSWRPVSITALLCRLSERLMYHRIAHQIETRDLRRGKSQFGFRRGVSTTLPLSGLSMFMRDGFRQRENYQPWDATDPQNDITDRVEYGTGTKREHAERNHTTLLVSIDGSDAFCKALPHLIVKKLRGMGLDNEARWIAELLRDRSLRVKEGGLFSDRFSLDRGAPQGGCSCPQLWSFIIDDLIERCETACRKVTTGCIVVPIIFADDINFAIRGFNPSSMIRTANEMLSIVRKWATENGVPMAKLQATWVTGGYSSTWASQWTEKQGAVIYDETVRCVPGTQSIKLLGLTIDTAANFGDHVDTLVETCESHLRWISGLAHIVKAEKLAILYRGLILSRLLYAVDSWYPFIHEADRSRLESIHYRACLIITGCKETSQRESVCYEAGFRTFDETARDEIVKLADALRRTSDGCKGPGSVNGTRVCFGPEWVTRLFRDRPMPTADIRRVRLANGDFQKFSVPQWPPADWSRFASKPDSSRNIALRDIGVELQTWHGGLRDGREPNPRWRPLPRIYPFAPHELRAFDKQVRFIVDPPGGLVKPQKPVEQMTDEEKAPFALANAERMAQLVRDNGSDAIFVFTDGSRTEASSHNSKLGRCAGAFVICRGADPTAPGVIVAESDVPASPVACVYSAELGAIVAALRYIAEHSEAIFAGHDNHNIVLVTDSKSALESMKTTWVRRIGHLEQDACRLVFDIAQLDAHVSMAFVFSHVGGAPGNAYADDKAGQACRKTGSRWVDNVWHVDTTRCILGERHATVDGKLDAFRFRERPAELGSGISAPLPRTMPRSDEILLFRARVGMITAAGGHIAGRPDDCPLCGAEQALRRNGLALEHIAECVQTMTHPPIVLSFADFWRNPELAVSQLRDVVEIVNSRPAALERQARDAAIAIAAKNKREAARRKTQRQQRQQKAAQQHIAAAEPQLQQATTQQRGKTTNAAPPQQQQPRQRAANSRLALQLAHRDRASA